MQDPAPKVNSTHPPPNSIDIKKAHSGTFKLNPNSLKQSNLHHAWQFVPIDVQPLYDVMQ